MCNFRLFTAGSHLNYMDALRLLNSVIILYHVEYYYILIADW